MFMGGEAKDLICAVEAAANGDISTGRFNDRVLMQKGCFILNEWGVGPKFNFSMYVRGSYSSDLADVYCAIKGNVPKDTSVDTATVSRLSDIIGRGPKYSEAYATAMLARKHNPKKSREDVVRIVNTLKPKLMSETEEASLSVFP
jgi:uncharacterized protein YwgA